MWVAGVQNSRNRSVVCQLVYGMREEVSSASGRVLKD